MCLRCRISFSMEGENEYTHQNGETLTLEQFLRVRDIPEVTIKCFIDENNGETLTLEQFLRVRDIPEVTIKCFIDENDLFNYDFQDPTPSSSYSTNQENIHEAHGYSPTGDINSTITKKLVLHRGHIFEELIRAFKTHNIDFQNIAIELILPNGKPEAAEDLGGVLRDTISEFWLSFYDKCTEGTDYKVPYIRHDFGDQEWKAIGKILVGGFQKEKYFPIKIAPTFISQCLDKEVSSDDLVNDFLKYVNEPDKELITTALQNFEEVNYNEILAFCMTYKSKWLPSADNFKKLIEGIAEQEIIQKAAFVSKCFRHEFEKITSTIDLKQIYKDLQPTVKNMISAFTIDKNLSEKNSNIHAFLIRYIKESDEKTRCSFLRFCTGSNLVIDKIKIQFIESDGFSRVPIGHTCTNLLQVPNTYENYVEFRNELNAIFISNIWVMDII